VLDLLFQHRLIGDRLALTDGFRPMTTIATAAERGTPARIESHAFSAGSTILAPHECPAICGVS
jgi:hypothetical protein